MMDLTRCEQIAAAYTKNADKLLVSASEFEQIARDLPEQRIECLKLSDRVKKEAQSLQKAAQTLLTVVQSVRSCEQRIIHIYQSEDSAVPETVFATSHFENLKEHEKLITIRLDTLDKPSADDLTARLV